MERNPADECITYDEALMSNQLQRWADCAAYADNHLSGGFWAWLGIYVAGLLVGGWIAYRGLTLLRGWGWLLWLIGGAIVLSLAAGLRTAARRLLLPLSERPEVTGISGVVAGSPALPDPDALFSFSPSGPRPVVSGQRGHSAKYSALSPSATIGSVAKRNLMVATR
jgi:hypothetical protein